LNYSLKLLCTVGSHVGNISEQQSTTPDLRIETESCSTLMAGSESNLVAGSDTAGSESTAVNETSGDECMAVSETSGDECTAVNEISGDESNLAAGSETSGDECTAVSETAGVQLEVSVWL
jgi:hypothetical protein